MARYPQPAHAEREPRRERGRGRHPKHSGRHVRFEAERRLQQGDRGRGRPRLGSAGGGVGEDRLTRARRPYRRTVRAAGSRSPAPRATRPRRATQPGRLPVAGQAEDGDRGVVRPHRTRVVAERVEPRATSALIVRRPYPLSRSVAGQARRRPGRPPPRRAARCRAGGRGWRSRCRPAASRRRVRWRGSGHAASATQNVVTETVAHGGGPLPPSRRRPVGRTRRAGRALRPRPRTRTPAPRTARSAARRCVPSRNWIESPESFQPWLARP